MSERWLISWTSKAEQTHYVSGRQTSRRLWETDVRASLWDRRPGVSGRQTSGRLRPFTPFCEERVLDVRFEHPVRGWSDAEWIKNTSFNNFSRGWSCWGSHQNTQSIQSTVYCETNIHSIVPTIGYKLWGRGFARWYGAGRAITLTWVRTPVTTGSCCECELVTTILGYSAVEDWYGSIRTWYYIISYDLTIM